MDLSEAPIATPEQMEMLTSLALNMQVPKEEGYTFQPFARQKPVLIDNDMERNGIPLFSIIEYDDSIICHSKLVPFVMFCESEKTGDMSFAKIPESENIGPTENS